MIRVMLLFRECHALPREGAPPHLGLTNLGLTVISLPGQ